MKSGDDLSEGETTENTSIEKENLTSLHISIEMDPKLNLLLSKIQKLEESNKKLEEGNKKSERETESLKVKDSEGDIDELWNYFNLISNGQDITKSIVFIYMIISDYLVNIKIIKSYLR